MASPVIQKLGKEPTEMLKGKETLHFHLSKALASNPGLTFKLLNKFAGVDSIVVQCLGHTGLSSDVFYFDGNGKVYRAHAHYERNI